MLLATGHGEEGMMTFQAVKADRNEAGRERMKRFLILMVLVTAFLFVGQTVRAIDVFHPGDLPDRGSFFIGAEMVSMKDRDLADGRLGAQALLPDSRRYLANLAYGITDRISVFAKVGAADCRMWNPNTGTNYLHDNGIAYGGGLRGVIYEDIGLGMRVGIGAQYFAFSPDDFYDATTGRRELDWREWQGEVFMHLGRRISESHPLFDPFRLTATGFYLGAKYGDVEAEWKTLSDSGTLSAVDNMGMFTGFDLTFNEMYMLTVEASLSDETAYTVGFTFKF